MTAILAIAVTGVTGVTGVVQANGAGDKAETLVGARRFDVHAPLRVALYELVCALIIRG